MEEDEKFIYIAAQTRLHDAMMILQAIYNPEDAVLNRYISESMAALDMAEDRIHKKLNL